MKKLLPISLSFTLAFSLISPSIHLVKAEGTSDVIVTDDTFPSENLTVLETVLEDTDNSIIYQVTESDGFTYEYHENTVVNGNETNVQIEKYKISGEQKVLVDEAEQTITELSENELSVTSTDSTEDVIINIDQIIERVAALPESEELPPGDTIDPIEPPVTYESTEPIKTDAVMYESTEPVTSDATSSTSSLPYVIQKGGSYIADTRYEIWSNSKATAIMNGNTPYYKNTTKTDYKFTGFKYLADDLKKQEINIASLGLIGMADFIYSALRGGQMLSMALIKQGLKQFGKYFPLIGTLVTLYQYGSTYLDARKAYRAI